MHKKKFPKLEAIEWWWWSMCIEYSTTRYASWRSPATSQWSQPKHAKTQQITIWKYLRAYPLTKEVVANSVQYRTPSPPSPGMQTIVWTASTKSKMLEFLQDNPLIQQAQTRFCAWIEFLQKELGSIQTAQARNDAKWMTQEDAPKGWQLYLNTRFL